jgi:hypothetical protein
VVAANDGEDPLHAVLAFLRRLEEHGLEHPVGRGAQVLRDALDAGEARRVLGLEVTRGGVVEGPVALADLALLDVGGVAGARVDEDGVLARVAVDHELVGGAAADGAGFCFDDGEVEPAAPEDVLVGGVHRVVLLVEPAGAFHVGAEGVGVLHEELAAAEQPGARAELVAELGLDLVEVQRERLVRRDAALHEVGDDLLVGGAEVHGAVVAVGEPEEQVAVGVGAPGLLEQVHGGHRGHEELTGAGAVHLLADDVRDLREHAPGEGEVVVDARADLADVARSAEEDVRGGLGVGGGLLGGRDQRAGPEADVAATGGGDAGSGGGGGHGRSVRRGVTALLFGLDGDLHMVALDVDCLGKPSQPPRRGERRNGYAPCIEFPGPWPLSSAPRRSRPISRSSTTP